MALAATYTSENCPGIPKGVVVRVHTDKLAQDQPAAWANARKVHKSVWWENKLQETRESDICAVSGRI